MFSTYNLSAFGQKLKAERKAMGYTQQDVSRLCGINRDTLRRIEQGEGIPRYDTLELLSGVYKADLLELLRRHRSSDKLYTYYHRLDQLIANFDIDILNTLTQDYERFMQDNQDPLFDPNLYRQIQWMLQGISAYYSEDCVRRLKSLDLFVKSLQSSMPAFDLYNFKSFKYNLFEMRILLLIALSLAHGGDYKLSSQMLVYLLSFMLKKDRSDLDDVLLTIKVFVNLSYNAFNLDDFRQSLDYADQGIAYCNRHSNMFSLYLLYSRKGVAEFKLGLAPYRDSFHKSLQLLEIQGKPDLADTYRQILLDRYGLVID